MSQEYRVPENANLVPKTAMRSDVKRVVVHALVTEIADDAFRDWSNLAEIVFEQNSMLQSIGTHAFTGTALKSFTAPDSLRSIGEGAFAGCKSLKEVRLNQGLPGQRAQDSLRALAAREAQEQDLRGLQEPPEDHCRGGLRRQAGVLSG